MQAGLAMAGLIGVTWFARADTHLFAGATGLTPGSPLLFTTAASFEAASGWYLPMVLRTSGLNAGFYRGDVLTFTALAAADQGTGQLEGRALFGSRLAVQVVSVDGPTGGELQFWEGDGENPGNQITFRVPVGARDSTASLVISENDGAPGADPYGHIHGRAFTTTLPGRYFVGFRLIDVSTNGPGGGPLHAPSAVLTLGFQAGPTVDSLEVSAAGALVKFRSAPGVSNVLESTSVIAPGDWTPVAGPLRGNSTLQSLRDTNAWPGPRFYRLKLLNTPP